MTKKPQESREKEQLGPIEIAALDVEVMQTNVVGFSEGIILNRINEKAKRELLMPKGKKTAADKAASLKHNPIEEFRASPLRMEEPDAPTILAIPASAVKSAIRDAALDVPGARKAEIGRLTWVEGDRLPLYGIPLLDMRPTRNSDQNRTPDIRTRALVHAWCVRVRISFVASLIRRSAVANLLSMAGRTIGIGDYRQGKGAGNFGQFRICEDTDPELIEILKLGREQQLAALETVRFSNFESEDLFTWFTAECKTRGVPRAKEVA